MKQTSALLITGIAALLAICGCVSDGKGPDAGMRMERYRPDVADRRIPVPSRVLKRGDKVIISLRDIPHNQEIPEMVDDKGFITLDLISSIRVEGMTPAEAEKAIERAYIEGDFYKAITVIVVAQEEEFFIRGEVKREGKYPISRDLTLTQAIAIAGGYTEYATKRKVQINRQQESWFFNTDRIEKGPDKDPQIKPGDMIIVHRWRPF